MSILYCIILQSSNIGETTGPMLYFPFSDIAVAVAVVPSSKRRRPSSAFFPLLLFFATLRPSVLVAALEPTGCHRQLRVGDLGRKLTAAELQDDVCVWGCSPSTAHHSPILNL